MRALVRQYALPAVEFHRVIHGYEVDFWVIDSPIVLECDGWDTHGRNKVTFERDRVRDGELTAMGYITDALHVSPDHPPTSRAGRPHPPGDPTVGAPSSGRAIVSESGTDPRPETDRAQIGGRR